MLGSWIAQREARVSYAAGAAALARGDCDLAMSWFADAVRSAQRFAPGYLGRGLIRLRKAQFDAAIEDLSEAIRLSGDARAFYLRSLCYQGKGNVTRERADRAEALRRDPGVARTLRDPAA
jgi:tetratricopeptide (TPR) repeat protein